MTRRPEPRSFNDVVLAQVPVGYGGLKFYSKKPLEIVLKLLHSFDQLVCTLDGRLGQEPNSLIAQLLNSVQILSLYLAQLFWNHEHVDHIQNIIWIQAIYNLLKELEEIAR